MPRALYSGSFDPVTRGHLDIVERAARVFDDLQVVVGNNPKRQEYAWVPEQTFWHHRAAILRMFLDRPYLFHTDALRTQLEQTARNNLSRSIARAERLAT